MRRRTIVINTTIVISAALGMAMSGIRGSEPLYTHDFGLEHQQVFEPRAENEYFPLRPGSWFRYEGLSDGAPAVVEVRVLDEVRVIDFEVKGQRKVARARVVEEREWEDGELVQVSLGYYAGCPRTGNVYAFGEDVVHYEGGQVTNREGSWMAGRGGALPGLYLPGFFLHGSRYCRENAPGIAMDRAENLQTGLTVETPGGRFDDCILILETSALEDDEETLKVYGAGVGLIIDDELELVDFVLP